MFGEAAVIQALIRTKITLERCGVLVSNRQKTDLEQMQLINKCNDQLARVRTF